MDSPDELAEEYDSPEAAEDAYNWRHNLYVRQMIEDVLGERGAATNTTCPRDKCMSDVKRQHLKMEEKRIRRLRPADE